MSTVCIADCCNNHLGQRKIMQEMIIQLAKTGVDFAKFQSFHADRLDPGWPDYTNAKNYYKSVELDYDDHAFLIETCYDNKIHPLFTAFDMDAAKILKDLDLPIVKIGSAEAENAELVKYCADNFPTVIVSSGMTTDQNIRYLRNLGCKVLYCVSRYPCPVNEIDFNRMGLFDGFSDHTPTLECAKKAVDMGMEYIERHYTLGKYLPGKDHLFSSTPDEFKELVDYRNFKDKIKLFKERWNG
jgi:N,N'-diacetyllegionaminate synthase